MGKFRWGDSMGTKKIGFTSDLYKWTPDKIYLNRETSGHMKHNINNELTKAIVALQLVESDISNVKHFNIINNALYNIKNYVEVMSGRIK